MILIGLKTLISMNSKTIRTMVDDASIFFATMFIILTFSVLLESNRY